MTSIQQRDAQSVPAASIICCRRLGIAPEPEGCGGCRQDRQGARRRRHPCCSAAVGRFLQCDPALFFEARRDPSGVCGFHRVGETQSACTATSGAVRPTGPRGGLGRGPSADLVLVHSWGRAWWSWWLPDPNRSWNWSSGCDHASLDRRRPGRPRTAGRWFRRFLIPRSEPQRDQERVVRGRLTWYR